MSVRLFAATLVLAAAAAPAAAQHAPAYVLNGDRTAAERDPSLDCVRQQGFVPAGKLATAGTHLRCTANTDVIASDATLAGDERTIAPAM